MLLLFGICIGIIIGLLLATTQAFSRKFRWFYTEVYIDVDGDFIDTIINIFKNDKKIWVRLVPGSLYKDKDKNTKYSKSYVRISKDIFLPNAENGIHLEVRRVPVASLNRL